MSRRCSVNRKKNADLEKPDFKAAVERMKKLCAGRVPDENEEKENTGAVLRQIGVPERTIARIREGGLRDTEALRRVLAWAKDPNAWCLVLSGGVGLGKSTAAAMWLTEWAADRRPGPGLSRRWYAASEFSQVDFYGDQIPRMSQLRHLVLDDLGTEYSDKGGMFGVKLDMLIDARYRDCRRTIVTTNLGPDEFRRSYDKRVVDRLREDSVWFSITGESWRGR